MHGTQVDFLVACAGGWAVSAASKGRQKVQNQAPPSAGLAHAKVKSKPAKAQQVRGGWTSCLQGITSRECKWVRGQLVPMVSVPASRLLCLGAASLNTHAPTFCKEQMEV